MNHSKYLCISAGASIGFLMAICMGVDPTYVMPIFTAIMIGLVAAFVLESRSEKGSDENRRASARYWRCFGGPRDIRTLMESTPSYKRIRVGMMCPK